MARGEQTGKKVGKLASRLLSNPKSRRPVKSVSASALTQRPNKGRKGAKRK